MNPGNENGIKILNANGIKTDHLIPKIPMEDLQLLEGEYQNVDNREWKIKLVLTEGVLYANDRGYKFKVLPVNERKEFVNPDDGASLVFDTKDKNAITLMLAGRVRFRKVM
jgi:hypothetical protein